METKMIRCDVFLPESLVRWIDLQRAEEKELHDYKASRSEIVEATLWKARTKC